MNARLLLASGVLAIAVIVGVFALSSSKPAAPVARIAAVSPARTPAPAAQTSTQPSAQPSTPPKDEPFVIKRILPIEGAIKYGDWHWDEAEVPAGPIVVTVDLDARVLSVFRGGYEIGTTAVLLGTEDTPTPLGVFPITEKDKDHVSNIYTGAPMPYMQRLTNDGITLHGSKVELGYASHGCVGMPVDFAAKLFATTKVGDKVYITRGKQVGLGDDLAGA